MSATIMAEDKKRTPYKCYTQLSSEPETDAQPYSSVPSPFDRRNHPSGAIRRTQQGSGQHFSSGHDSGLPASEEYSERSGSDRSKICPSGHESFIYDISSNSSGQKISSLSDDELIDRYLPELEDESLKVGYFDVMIIYCEEDRAKAEAYKDHLNNDIKTKSGKHIKALLFDDSELESLSGSKFEHLEKAFERCTFAFVYLTKEFCENDDGWCRVSSEECLMKAIYDRDKKWCVVPVYTVQRNKANFKIPMGLNALKGINYYNNDEFYRRGLTKLLEDKLFVREANEKNQREKILADIKKHLLEKNEREHTSRLNRQMSEREFRQQEERHQLQINAMTQQTQGRHRYAFSSSDSCMQREMYKPSNKKQTELLQGQGQSMSTLRQPESVPDKSDDSIQSIQNLRDALEHSELEDIHNEEGSGNLPGEPNVHPISLEPDSPDSQLSHNINYGLSSEGLQKGQIVNHPHKGDYLPGQYPPGQYPSDKHVPGQHQPGQHLPGHHAEGKNPPSQYPPGQQSYQHKPGRQREVVEIHHHHHYTAVPVEEDVKNAHKVINIIGAKNVQIGEGGSIVSAEGGRTVEGTYSDKDSSSDSEQQSPVKKGCGGVDESQSIPSADGYSTTDDNLTRDKDIDSTDIDKTSTKIPHNTDKHVIETNRNHYNDQQQTHVKTVNDDTLKKVTSLGEVSASKMPDKSSTESKMPDKSLGTYSMPQGLSFNSMMSDKSHIQKGKSAKIKPFKVNKSDNPKPILSVPPMKKESPRKNDIDNLLNNVISGSNDRELEDPMNTDYNNSLKNPRNQTYTEEKELSDETGEKVAYRSSDEATSVKHLTDTDASGEEDTSLKHLTDTDETEVKQYYVNPEQNYTSVATGNGYKSVTIGNKGYNGLNHTSDFLKSSVNTNNSASNIDIVSPRLTTSNVEDPEETKVLKPVSGNQLSGDLDTDGGDFESLPSSINSSSDFTILHSDSDTLTEEDKEVNAVKQVLEMGFTETDVKKCLKELQRKNPGRKHFSVGDLFDMLCPTEGQTSLHKSSTDTVLSSKKSDLPNRQVSQSTSSSSSVTSGNTKDKCCVS